MSAIRITQLAVRLPMVCVATQGDGREVRIAVLDRSTWNRRQNFDR
jgi:hypothetical protein